MELFLKSDGRYSFEKKAKVATIVVDEQKEERDALLSMLESILPDMEKIDRLIRNVGVELTKHKVIFSFKIRQRFFQALLDMKLLKDETTARDIFTRILKKEVRDFQWTR